jgi:hypothetical protein
LAPVEVLVLGNQEFLVDIGRKIFFLEPSFPIDRESARCSNEVFCNMNLGIPKQGLESIKYLREKHIQSHVVSFKCAQEIIPLGLYVNVFDFGYVFEQFQDSLWFDPVQFPSFLRRNHGGKSIFDVDDAVNVGFFILKLIHVCC